MYTGEIVEMATRDEFFQRPRHPYAQKLFDSLPRSSKRGETLAVISGNVPRLDQTFSGCRFAARCDQVFAACHSQVPRWIPGENGSSVRCHFYNEALQKPKLKNGLLNPCKKRQQAKQTW